MTDTIALGAAQTFARAGFLATAAGTRGIVFGRIRENRQFLAYVHIGIVSYLLLFSKENIHYYIFNYTTQIS